MISSVIPFGFSLHSVKIRSPRSRGSTGSWGEWLGAGSGGSCLMTISAALATAMVTAKVRQTETYKDSTNYRAAFGLLMWEWDYSTLPDCYPNCWFLVVKFWPLHHQYYALPIRSELRPTVDCTFWDAFTMTTDYRQTLHKQNQLRVLFWPIRSQKSYCKPIIMARKHSWWALVRT